MRQEERVRLLESCLLECCDEISEITFALVQFSDPKNRVRHEHRLNEVRLEMKKVWEEYTLLVKNGLPDLSSYY